MQISKSNQTTLFFGALVLLTAAEIIYAIVSLPMAKKDFYSTPAETVMNAESIGGDQILQVLEENGLALAVYRKGDAVASRIVCKEDQGWTCPLAARKPPAFQTEADGYRIVIRDEKGKKAVVLSDTTPNRQAAEVFDSLGSRPRYFETTAGTSVIREWFWTLEEIPENYSITIGGTTIPISWEEPEPETFEPKNR